MKQLKAEQRDEMRDKRNLSTLKTKLGTGTHELAVLWKCNIMLCETLLRDHEVAFIVPSHIAQPQNRSSAVLFFFFHFCF